MASSDSPLPTPVFCCQCGRALAPAEVSTLAGNAVCAACKPAYLLRLQQAAVPAPAPVRYKGFWIRLVAKIVDGVILSLILSPFFFLFGFGYFREVVRRAAMGQQPDLGLQLQFMGQMALFELFGAAVVFLYNTILLGKFQATIGKMAIGAKVVRADGTPISWGQAAGRTAMEWVSAFILYIGYLIAAFDGKKRALHDMVAGTFVVAK